ncbi:MAG: ABC transporter permease [Microvirga sp.]
MPKYVLRRLLLLIPTLIGMSLLIFLLLRLLPGDVVDLMIGNDAQVDASARQALRKSLGLADPLPVQYVKWVGRLLRGDPGVSLRSGQPVGSLLLHSLPVTLELALFAVLIATAVAIPLGVISGVKRDTALDFGSRVTGLIGLSLPGFWIATLALLFTSRAFHWVPPVVYISPLRDPSGNLKQMFLPAAAIAVQLMAIEMRMTRTAMLEVLNQDYIRTARAKGLRDRVVVFRHALRNALIPVVTVIGLQVGVLFTGAILTETIFSWPGVGKWLIEAINRRDYPVLQGGTLLIGAVVMTVNLIVDLTYGLINPRIRHTR